MGAAQDRPLPRWGRDALGEQGVGDAIKSGLLVDAVG